MTCRLTLLAFTIGQMNTLAHAWSVFTFTIVFLFTHHLETLSLLPRWSISNQNKSSVRNGGNLTSRPFTWACLDLLFNQTVPQLTSASIQPCTFTSVGLHRGSGVISKKSRKKHQHIHSAFNPPHYLGRLYWVVAVTSQLLLAPESSAVLLRNLQTSPAAMRPARWVVRKALSHRTSFNVLQGRIEECSGNVITI